MLEEVNEVILRKVGSSRRKRSDEGRERGEEDSKYKRWSIVEWEKRAKLEGIWVSISCKGSLEAPFCTIQYNTIPYNTIQYNTIQYNTIQYSMIGGHEVCHHHYHYHCHFQAHTAQNIFIFVLSSISVISAFCNSARK